MPIVSRQSINKIMQVIQIPCLDDNYAYLIHDPESHITLSIDTPVAEVILDALSEQGWKLTHILNTHHHWDHVGGNLALKAATGCQIIGPVGEQERIPGIDQTVKEGDVLDLGNFSIEVTETPGHTLGHVVYYIPALESAFVGDTLFSMGCGRLFEGTAEQMWHSLQKLMRWPDKTLIYCAHEYTTANGQFALSIEPENSDLRKRLEQVHALRADDQPTIPTTMQLEKKTNPFLRANVPLVRRSLDLESAAAVDVFATIRKRKDTF